GDRFHSVLQKPTQRRHAYDAKHQYPPMRWPKRVAVQQIVDRCGMAEYAGSLLIKWCGARFVASGCAGSHQHDLVLKEGSRGAFDFFSALVRINRADHLPQRQTPVGVHGIAVPQEKHAPAVIERSASTGAHDPTRIEDSSALVPCHRHGGLRDLDGPQSKRRILASTIFEL